ncbi:MAG: cupin domain-containing protein [Canibacter sp.]
MSKYSHLPDEAQAIAETLGLEPLEHEGGLFSQQLLTAESTAIYYMLAKPDFSALHQLTETEVYHWYAGSALDLLVLHPDGRGENLRLGPDLEAGQRPQIVVPGGTMHGSSPAGDWCLVGTTMAPPFSWDGFKLGTVEPLQREYPEFSGRIAALIR